MGLYTVPQNVETEDNLIGPFGFRQFIYLMIAAALCGVAWGLSLISIILIIIPMPLILFLLLISLPLKKDQPMEIYIGALIRFYLGSKLRSWFADGDGSTVKIDFKNNTEEIPIKDITQEEAQNRLGFLSQIVDSKGWSTRGLNFNEQTNNFNDDFVNQSTEISDIMNNSNTTSINIENRIISTEQAYKQEIIQEVQGNKDNYDIINSNNNSGGVNG